MLKLHGHRRRANTMTDLDTEQVIATLCATLACALPPLSVNSHLETSLQPPWTEGKPHPSSGAVLQAGAGTDSVELSEHTNQSTCFLLLTNSLQLWPYSQIKLSLHIQTNPTY